MTHISSTTAHALKAANFPQPKIRVNQCWYSGHRFFQINDTASPLFIYERSNELPDWLAFAPTAEDILRELPPRFCIFFLKEQNQFVCEHQDSYGRSIAQYRASSSAEAAALAYLSLNPPTAP